jgi:hypothetical protein
MAKRGRKMILTRELTNQICGLLSEGMYIEAACSFVGIGESTFYEWRAKARAFDDQDESDWELLTVDDNLERVLLTEFTEAVEKSQAQAELVALRVINDDPSWQSKAWYLERSKPHRWGRRTQITGVYDEDDQPTPVQIADPRAAVLAFVGELGEQLEADGIKPSSDQTKGNDEQANQET